MKTGRSVPHGTAPLVGRDEALQAIGRQLSPVRAGSGWVLVEGPPGSGRTTFLAVIAAMAEERGLDALRLAADEREGVVREQQALDALTAAAGETPAVLCVDEVQWLGSDALGRLDRLRHGSRPTLLVGAIRSGSRAAAGARLDALAADGATTTIRLAALGAADVGRLLAAAGVEGDAELAATCTALCGGNAGLAAALVARLAELGRTVGAAEVAELAKPLLDRVGRYCAVAIARCGEDAAAIADAAVVLGDGTPLWLAAELAGVDRTDAAEAADDLVRAGLLASADPLAFAVPLVHSALDARASGARRDELHRQAARLLAGTAGGADAAADHLLAAPPSGEPWAAALLREAAAAASERGRSDVAAVRLERALAEPLPPEARGELFVELGEARDRAGLEGAEEAYRNGLRALPPEARPRVHLLLGRTCFGTGDYHGAFAEFDRGLAGLDDPDDPLAAELIAGCVAAARFDGTLEGEAERRLATVVDRTGPGRSAAERALLAEIALERAIRGAPRDAVLSLAHRAWADGRLLDGDDPHGIVLSEVAAVLTWSDAFADSERVLTVALERAEAEGEALAAATARYLRAWPRYYRGALAEAEADVRAALGGAGWEMYEPSARAVLAHVLIERGEHDRAREALVLDDPEPWRQTPPYAMLLEARARLHVLAGALDAAATDLAAAGEVMTAMGSCHPFCPWRSRLGLVTARRGDLRGGLELVESELEQAREVGVPRPLGMALHARGLLRQLEGRDGVDDLQAAVEALDGCGARLEQARVLADLGAALAAAGGRREARAPLREAVDLAGALGATEIAETAERELRRSGARPRRGALDAPAGLTASELRVARLATRGLTNREIADELVVTTHTVRFHLGNAYRKLGVATRAEMAAALRGDEPG